MTGPARCSVAICLGLSVSCSGPQPTPPRTEPTTAATQATAAAADSAPPAAPAAAPSHDPPGACQPPPVGMVCIPAGPAVIGADDGDGRQRPKHRVEVSTFYLDRHEITNRQYEQCVRDRGCRRRPKLPKHLSAPSQPALRLHWEAARRYCLWAGKRLPTEAEWEKAARGEHGETFPWGAAPADCARAQIDGCPPKATRTVGSFPEGAYGLFDMAGNGFEWVHDWESDCYEGCSRACGADCLGSDPQGPYAGGLSPRRVKRRVLKGGAFDSGPQHAKAAARRIASAHRRGLAFTARCASSTPLLATFPPLVITNPLPPVADPLPPQAEHQAALRAVVEDTDILKLRPCHAGGVSGHDCRDPFSYVTTNEPFQYLWAPYIRNRGGGYVGVGAGQNYSLIAAARSQWVWLFDYDPMVVRLHHIIRAVVLAADSPERFVAAFEQRNFGQTRAIVEQAVPPGEREQMVRTLLDIRPQIHEVYRRSRRPAPDQAGFGWLRHPEHYQYIRLLFQQGRVALLAGNLLTDVVMPSIAASARRIGVPIRIFYTSNADDKWPLTQQYRDNLGGLPFDEHSVVLRTTYPRGPKPSWYYVVHHGLDLQRRIVHSAWTQMHWFVSDAGWFVEEAGRRAAKANLVVTIGLPARTEHEPSER